MEDPEQAQRPADRTNKTPAAWRKQVSTAGVGQERTLRQTVATQSVALVPAIDGTETLRNVVSVFEYLTPCRI